MGVDAFDPVAPSPAPANVGGYLATATNAITARTLSNHFGDILNVKDFGAVCNGTTDDTAAMQALITDLGSTAITVIVSGPTKVGSNITIPATAPVRFEGNGSFTGAGIVTYTAWTAGIFTSPVLTGTPIAPTAAVDTNTTQLATTAFVIGQAASATPIVDGTGTVGTSNRYARQDHIHPTDTSRAPLASPTFTGTATTPKLVTSATSGNDAIEIVSGSIISLDGASATQTLRFNAGDAASIPGAQAWQAPTLLNSWANIGGAFAVAGYYRDAAGIVHLGGSISNSPGTAGNVNILTLAAGYRPASRRMFIAWDVTPAVGRRIDIDNSGNVFPPASVPASATISLDGISFRAEQ